MPVVPNQQCQELEAGDMCIDTLGPKVNIEVLTVQRICCNFKTACPNNNKNIHRNFQTINIVIVDCLEIIMNFFVDNHGLSY